MTRTTQSDTITPLIVVILHQVFRGLAFISFHRKYLQFLLKIDWAN